MLFTGILLTILLGYSFINLISRQFTLIEKIGLSFPLGMAVETVLMLVIDQLRLGFTPISLFSSEILLLVLLNIPIIRNRKEVIAEIKQPVAIPWSSLNMLWALFIIMTIYLEYMNFSKCMYFPTFDRDSLAGFDTMGFIAAKEHTYLRMSIFQGDYMPSVHEAGSYITYSPFVQLSYAYVYALGASTSKLIPALMYLFFLIAFYGVVRRIAGDTLAAIATFFVLLTPEMVAFSSLSATNAMHAVFASLGVIYIYLWLDKRGKKDLYLGAVILGANIWCRTEGIVFIGAALCVMLIDSIRKKQYRNLLISGGIMLAPQILWMLFMKINGLYSEGIAIMMPFWDSEKAGTIFTYMENHYLNTLYYGWTFLVFVIAIIVNIWYLIKKKSYLAFLIMIVLASFFYMAVLYQIDYKWDTITNVLAYSAKRFLFCFVPLAWCFVAVSPLFVKGMNKVEKFLALRK